MIGNNSVCKVIGMGNICLKLHDRPIKEVKQNRHVPYLKRNLIPLGMLDQMRCGIKLESGELNIINGSTPVMKGSRKNRVDVLYREVITGVSHVSVKNEEDNTRLWYLKLWTYES